VSPLEATNASLAVDSDAGEGAYRETPLEALSAPGHAASPILERYPRPTVGPVPPEWHPFTRV
jgi:hypothetical protein